MAALTTTQIRAALKARVAALFPTYHVYDSRIRDVDDANFPVARVGVSSGACDDDGLEELALTVMVAHRGTAADFAADDADAALQDRIDADLMTLRASLLATDVATTWGSVTRMTWDYGASDEGRRLAAWFILTAWVQRRNLPWDDLAEDDFDTAMIETTAADNVVTTEVDL